jgi:hypothetical protein
MKASYIYKIMAVTLIGYVFLAGCSEQSNSSETNQKGDAEKAAELKVINSEKETTVDSHIENLNEKEKLLNDLKQKYTHIRAKYIDFDSGDLAHYIFEGEDGKQYDFCDIDDKAYDLIVDDRNSGDGVSINKNYRGKTFDIFYKIEKVDLYPPNPPADVEVVKKMILVE